MTTATQEWITNDFKLGGVNCQQIDGAGCRVDPPLLDFAAMPNSCAHMVSGLRSIAIDIQRNVNFVSVQKQLDMG